MENYTLEQAKAQYESLAAMVAALTVDYDRLEEMRDCEELDEEEKEELAALEESANGNTSEDEAREAIENDPLCVEVCSGWYSPGQTPEPEEFRILLCTGGPAVQIRGELDSNNEPCSAWLAYQDWGTPWTPYFDADQETLLTYCRQFYFGE